MDFAKQEEFTNQTTILKNMLLCRSSYIFSQNSGPSCQVRHEFAAIEQCTVVRAAHLRAFAGDAKG